MDRSTEWTGLSRRDFVKTGVTAAAVGGLPLGVMAGEPDGNQEKSDGASGKKDLVPMRVLGRTGAKVSILNFGAGRAEEPRMLNAVYDAGIRIIDTADCYAKGESEKALGKWMAEKGNRKEFFIVTKDHPNTPDEYVEMVDRRLKPLQTDYIDLFFIHGLGLHEPSVGNRLDDKQMSEIPKSKQWAKAAEKLKKSGKVRFVGFSMHGEMPLRIELLNGAAAGGWVDAIMLAYDLQVVRENAEFNKALDACHKAGVGLISMKEMRRVEHVSKFLPEFKEMGLTPHQAVLHAVWTDERIACICSYMPNLKILKENADAARNFKPMEKKKLGAVMDLYQRHGTRLCNGCDGRCRRAGGTKAALNDITRYLSYYEADGRRDEARRLYATLTPEQQQWHDADLAAASRACVSKLDFASLLPRADEKLA